MHLGNKAALRSVSVRLEPIVFAMSRFVSMKEQAFFRRSLVALVLAGIMPVFAVAGGMKTLRGHVPAVVAKLPVQGTLAPTNRLNLAIGLPLRDEQGLSNFLEQVSDPASPHYHQYLAPAQFTEKFGPTEADYAAVVHFAETNGLIVTAAHGNRLLLDVNGSIADIQRMFHIKLNTYQHPTEKRDFFAPDTEPTVDASLSVTDISGLNNYVLPHPKCLRIDSTTSSNAAPKSGSGAGGAYLGNDFRAAYLPGVTLTGSGQVLGVFLDFVFFFFFGYLLQSLSLYSVARAL